MEVVSGYEQSREKRIKENLERMQKLGIVDLSLKLKSINQNKRRPYTKKTPQSDSHHACPIPAAPVRRSSRLQNSTPVSYSEMQLAKNDKSLDDDPKMMREVGSKPEVYTEEHDKLLGSTEMSWTLFVDGYGKDGKRIYDPVRGKTCHQCRQKTLGHRTNCSSCNMVQGQFCGDCLYMRYGEHVLEANQNPNWICPACRGICNCSFCRQAKGWPPTGTMYKKISSLGYKSVAHYLVQTRRASTDSDKDAVSTPVSAKRSLPFSDAVTLEQDDLSKSNDEKLKVDDPLPVKEMEFLLDNKLDESIKVSEILEGDDDAEIKTDNKHLKVDDPLTKPEMDGFSCENETDNKLDESLKVPETPEGGNDTEVKVGMILVGSETSTKLTEESVVAVPTTPDSIGGGLRKRPNYKIDVGSVNGDSKDAEDEQTPDIIAGNSKQKSGNRKRNAKDVSVASGVDSIARRLKMRRRA